MEALFIIVVILDVTLTLCSLPLPFCVDIVIFISILFNLCLLFSMPGRKPPSPSEFNILVGPVALSREAEELRDNQE
jgi:hypothetical protein